METNLLILDKERKSFKGNLVLAFFPAALKKLLHVRSPVFNCKQIFIPRTICKKTYKVMFFELSVSLHSTDTNS